MPGPKKDQSGAPAPAGHNGPSHDDIRMAVNEMVGWNQKRAELNSAISTFRKGLKAKGITLGVLDDNVRMLEWSPEEVKAHYAERNWYAEAMRFPIGTQLELYGTEQTPDPVREQLKWRNIGFKDGLAARGWPNEPPEGCPPEAVQSYGQGHEEGSQTVRAAFADRQKKLAAAPEKKTVALKPETKPEGEEDGDEDLSDEAIRARAKKLKDSGFLEPTSEETSFAH